MSIELNTLCRGLVGHFSFMSTTSSHTVYSEYMLYEPVLRILYAKGFQAHCEFTVIKTKKGYNKRIDFRVKNDKKQFGIEIKWAKAAKINVDNDIQKLKAYSNTYNSPGYLIVFGQYKYISNLKFSNDPRFESKGKLVNWDSGKTNYAACWYRFA